MKFDDLDRKMRRFETAHDYCVLPEMYMVARIDGRNFTRLTREVHPFEAPFDSIFRDHMVATTQHLMQCGFRIIYGYTQSDEISLLFHPDDETFGRKLRKCNSILAGEASACFSMRLGDLASFDCRISELPNQELVVDYFRWRQEDAHRNSLNAHCYWMLRKKGMAVGKATEMLSGMSVADKNELLFQSGINYNMLPAWQKRGVGLKWELYDKAALDPSGQAVNVQRRRVSIDYDLPFGDDYGSYIGDILENSSNV